MITKVRLSYLSTSEEWAKRYNAIHDDIPHAMAIDSSGNVNVTGGELGQ